VNLIAPASPSDTSRTESTSSHPCSAESQDPLHQTYVIEMRLTDFGEIRLLHLQSILYNGDTSVGNNTVNGTEGLVNLLEGRLDLFGVSNITLPCLDLDTVLLG